MKKVNDNCISCKKEIKFMKKPYENNYINGVDILCYPHYGSNHADLSAVTGRSNSLNVTPFQGVICDECYSKWKETE